MAVVKDIKKYKDFEALVNQYNKIIIFRKDNPDADAYGSQLGLKEVLKVNFPDKEVYAAGQNSDFLNPIGRMDTIDSQTVQDALAIIVDSASADWIDNELWKSCKQSVKIDDHPEKQSYGDVDITDETMSTCSELLAEICFDLKWRIDEESARCFLLGILDGTSYFRTGLVGQHTFVMLGKLIEISPDLKDIFDSMQLVTDGEIKLKKYIVNHFKTTVNGTTYVYIPKSKLDAWGVEPNRATSFIWLLLDFSQGEFTMMFTEYAKDKIRAQFRSKTRPVNLFAAKYNGWGTANSAGAFITSKKQVKEILNTLDNEII